MILKSMHIVFCQPTMCPLQLPAQYFSPTMFMPQLIKFPLPPSYISDSDKGSELGL